MISRTLLFLVALAHGVAHAVVELTDATAIASTGGSTCALMADSSVKCWGPLAVDAQGQAVATLVATTQPLPPSKAISGGGGFCVLTLSGDVACVGSFPSYVAASPTEVAALSRGGAHACILTSSGGVKCWGTNSEGQLGDGTTTDSVGPVSVVGLESGVKQVVTGNAHSCALTIAGTVKCWGSNARFFLGAMTVGQLGNGTEAIGTQGLYSATPVDVVDLPAGITRITGSTWGSCAITPGGAVKCWGGGSNRPYDAGGLTAGVLDVAGAGGIGPRISLGFAPALFYHHCALTTEGAVKCWGDNQYGQLGDGTTSSRYDHALAVSGLENGVMAITAGVNHSCALLVTGRVRCWGENGSGSLGDGTQSGEPAQIVPDDVATLSSGVSAISAGSYHTCVKTASGGAKCWGANQIHGRQSFTTGALGDGTYLDRVVPVDVLGLQSSVQAVSSGDTHSCAILTGGAVFCWGSNYQGELGDGSQDFSKFAPVQVSGLGSGAQAVAGGGNFSCAIVSGGAVMCWGSNSYGQLGDNTTESRRVPGAVLNLPEPAAQLALGYGHACARTPSGNVWCWGRNAEGQLGDGTISQRLAPVMTLTGVSSVAAGRSHTCAVLTSGALKCWGNNDHGQLGDGTLTNRPQPGGVNGLASGVVAVGGGWWHTCAVLLGGGVKCWGWNSRGELGDGSLIDRLTPAAVASNASFASVTAGEQYTCALTTSGGAMCWGWNEYGQLGSGTVSGGPVKAHPVAVLAGFELTVEVTGTGAGSVSSSPSGIDCGAACSMSFTGSSPILTATPAAGSVFTGWSGGGCSGYGACTPPLAPTMAVRANFAFQSPIPRLANISTRMSVGIGDDVAIAGFVIGGPVAKTLIVLAKGPSLAAYGVANVLSNPTLQLVRGSDQGLIATNDDWGTALNAAQIRASGFAPSSPLESAVLMTLAPGSYTAIVAGSANSTGVAIVEVYELDHPEVPLLNISTRGKISTSGDVMIGGFVIQGDGSQTVVVTAKGPSLGNFGVANALSNPTLTLVRASDGSVVTSNDDWGRSSNSSEIALSGFAPSNGLESAVLVTLQPGAYTAIVSGVGGATGVALVEVYKVQQ